MVYIVLGAGFEEMEAVVPCDLLRRAGVDTQLAGIGSTEILGSRGITVKADCTVEEAKWEQADMIVLPGGLGGVKSILNCETVMEAVKKAFADGRFVAAICAAPTILAKLGITDQKKATCYPGMEGEMGQALMCEVGCATDGRVITGRAAGSAFEFGFALIAALRGEEKAKQVAAEVVYS